MCRHIARVGQAARLYRLARHMQAATTNAAITQLSTHTHTHTHIRSFDVDADRIAGGREVCRPSGRLAVDCKETAVCVLVGDSRRRLLLGLAFTHSP